MATNPYANNAQDYAERQAEYIADNRDNPYAWQGYATPLDVSYDGTPDGTRENVLPRYDSAVDPSNPIAYWDARNQDLDNRESVVKNTRQVPEIQEQTKRAAPSPYLTQKFDQRWTAQLSPNTYSFQRPMTGGTPQRFTGIHSSLASNSREDHGTEIYGMTPPRRPDVTYRLDPVPQAIAANPPVQQAAGNVDDIPSSNRAYRLV